MTRTKTQERNESRARRPPKARKRRAKRKAGPGASAPKVRSLTGVRGKGPSVRNAQVTRSADRNTRHCPSCAHQQVAGPIVTWDYWHRGTWRKARRRLCDKHARQLKARLKRARKQT